MHTFHIPDPAVSMTTYYLRPRPPVFALRCLVTVPNVRAKPYSPADRPEDVTTVGQPLHLFIGDPNVLYL